MAKVEEEEVEEGEAEEDAGDDDEVETEAGERWDVEEEESRGGAVVDRLVELPSRGVERRLGGEGHLLLASDCSLDMNGSILEQI